MSDQQEVTDPPESRVLGIRWDTSELDRLDRAAALLSEREHFRVTVTDVIRRGTRRELEAILQDGKPEGEVAS